MNRIVKRLAVPLSAAAVLGTAGFAYMAGGTVAPSTAGLVHSAISGINVESVHYYLCNGDEASSSDPDGFSQICYANLVVQQPDHNAPIPSSVDVKIGANGTWVGCTQPPNDTGSNYADNSRLFICNWQSAPADPNSNTLFVSAVG